MGIGKEVEEHELGGGGGEFCKSGAFRNCELLEVAVVTGKEDKLESYILLFKVGSYSPGKDKNGNRYPEGTHMPQDIVKWMTKVKQKYRSTYINNIKLACLGILRQLAADNEKDPAEVVESDITAKVVDEMIFCNDSRVPGIFMDFNVTEEAPRSNPDGVVTKFKWLVHSSAETEDK